VHRDEEHESEDLNQHDGANADEQVDLPASFFESAEETNTGHELATESPGATDPNGHGSGGTTKGIENPKTLRDRLLAWVRSFRERLEGRKQNRVGTLTPKSRISQDRTKVTIAIAGASILAMVIFLVTFTRPASLHKPSDQRAHPNLGRPENSGASDGRSVVPLRSAAGVKPEDRDGRISDQDILNTTKLKPRSHTAPPVSNQNNKDYAVNRIPFPPEGTPEPAVPQIGKYRHESA
jgi:hypothetical protein